MKDYTRFLESLASTDTGRTLIEYLKQEEIKYADIRNLNQTPAEVRIDALKLLREMLLDRLMTLSGELDPPNTDEYH